MADGRVLDLSASPPVIRDATADDTVTRRLAVMPEDGEPKAWLKLLNESVPREDRQGAIDFLQLWFGYCLTGDVDEHRFLFIHGEGRNGKGRTVDAVKYILGEYANRISGSTLLTERDEHDQWKLKLCNGSRLSVVDETARTSVWNLGNLKTVTGGGEIDARGMHQHSQDYRVTSKLTITGNHLPRLMEVDTAIRERLLLLPFPYSAQVRRQKIGIKTASRSRANSDVACTRRPAIPGIGRRSNSVAGVHP